MFKPMSAALIALLIHISPVSAKTDEKEADILKWPDLLDPETQSFEDPFRALTFEQLDKMRSFARASNIAADETADDVRRSEAQSMMDASRVALAEDGIDAEELLEQRWIVADLRKRAAIGGNPEVDGKTVALAGFAVPGPPEADGTPVVYLVPQRGMCSHVPPPNPNQMIRARINDDWKPSMMHEPVRLTGALKIAPTEQVFNVVDGPVLMHATFEMSVTDVETVPGAKQDQNPLVHSRWGASMAERLTNGVTLPTPSSD